MRRLHVEGYGRRGALATEAGSPSRWAPWWRSWRATDPFAVVDVQDPAGYLPRRG